jgi:hypothetical protein
MSDKQLVLDSIERLPEDASLDAIAERVESLAAIRKSLGQIRRVVMSLTHPLTTTTFELPGYRVTKSFGVVRGIMVRSRSVIGNFGASIQAIFGGNISLYTNLCERAREDTFNLMLTHAGAARRQRGHRRALRRDGNRAGHHRGAVLRHGGVSVEPAALTR